VRRTCARSLEDLREEQDQLSVERGVVRAERLGVDLRELAEAPRLWCLVTEERTGGPDLHRLWQLVHAVLDVGPADAGGSFGPERERAAGLVLEGEHLLLDDVRGLPHPAGEQLGVLEHRRLHRLVARSSEQVARHLHDSESPARVRRQHVDRAARGLELLHLASSARNEFVARSAASVVVPM
jgi:hypothetical protein